MRQEGEGKCQKKNYVIMNRKNGAIWICNFEIYIRAFEEIGSKSDQEVNQWYIKRLINLGNWCKTFWNNLGTMNCTVQHISCIIAKV